MPEDEEYEDEDEDDILPLYDEVDIDTEMLEIPPGWDFSWDIRSDDD